MGDRERSERVEDKVEDHPRHILLPVRIALRRMAPDCRIQQPWPEAKVFFTGRLVGSDEDVAAVSKPGRSKSRRGKRRMQQAFCEIRRLSILTRAVEFSLRSRSTSSKVVVYS